MDLLGVTLGVMPQVSVSIPEGGYIHLTLKEADGTPAVIDLTPHASALLSLGAYAPPRKDSDSLDGEAWTIESSDGVAFDLLGVAVPPEAGLTALAEAVLYAIEIAVAPFRSNI